MIDLQAYDLLRERDDQLLTWTIVLDGEVLWTTESPTSATIALRSAPPGATLFRRLNARNWIRSDVQLAPESLSAAVIGMGVANDRLARHADTCRNCGSRKPHDGERFCDRCRSLRP